MKKVLLLIASVTVLFGVTSCNSDSTPSDYGIGSYYVSGNYIMNYDGTKYTLTRSYWTDLDARRYLIEFNGSIPDGTPSERGEGVTISMTELYNGSGLYALFPVVESSAYEDPVIGLSQYQNKPYASTVTNFLLFQPSFFAFTENAEKNNEYAYVDFELEIDGFDELVPGPQNDTINMWLKFFNNRAEGEKINTDPEFGRGNSYITFDLEDGPRDFFDTSDDVTYIIKLNYQSYEWDGSSIIDESKVYSKFATCEWTPKKPYSSTGGK